MNNPIVQIPLRNLRPGDIVTDAQGKELWVFDEEIHRLEGGITTRVLGNVGPITAGSLSVKVALYAFRATGPGREGEFLYVNPDTRAIVTGDGSHRGARMERIVYAKLLEE
jgi:hypothetical protein